MSAGDGRRDARLSGTDARRGAFTDGRPPAAVGGVVLQVDVSALAELVAALVVEGLGERATSSSPWLDVERAAAYLGWSTERVRKLVQRRSIPFHQEKPGARVS